MARSKPPRDTTLPLFPEEAPRPASSTEYVARNKTLLARWSGKGIHFGTSSWKYPGWKGMVYQHPYPSKRAFEQECLAEYAALFPTVCADFALYDFPDPAVMQRINDQTPEGFCLSLKVTDRITIRRYPSLPRHGSLAGTENPDFLNAALFEDAFLKPLQVLGKKVGAIIFEFSTFHPSSGMNVDRFIAQLDAFLGTLPRDFQYAVEIRNADFLTGDYLAMLRSHGVAHVLNNWTRMPPIVEQITIAGILTAPFTVARALLVPGRTYADAVSRFQPYDRIQEESPELRQGLVETVHRCLAEQRTLYAYVNNRAEGNSPKTIEAILEHLDRYPEEKL